jgi:hypothetical protein
MCDCSDFEAPAVFEEITRRSRKWHRCCECKGLIEPCQHYWESRGLWDGEWSTFRTCGSCYILRSLVDCFEFGALAAGLAEDDDLRHRIQGRDVRSAYAGMLRRGRRADLRILRRKAHADD